MLQHLLYQFVVHGFNIWIIQQMLALANAAWQPKHLGALQHPPALSTLQRCKHGVPCDRGKVHPCVRRR